MSQTPEHPTAPVATSASTDRVVVDRERRSNRVVQAAAWVGIVVGVVFVIAVIFFSGFILGRHSGGDFDGPRHHHGMMFRDGPPMMGPGFGPGGPGMYGPDRPGQGNPEPPSPPSRP